MQGKAFLPPIETAPRPMTLAEKIFAAHLVRSSGATDALSASPGAGPARVGVAAVKPGDAGFARTDLRFSHEYVTPMAAIFFDQLVGRDAPANDPSSIVFFRDHLTFLDEVLSEQKRKMGLLDLATQLKLKQEDFARQRGIRLHGELKDRKGAEGICHSVVLESYALPGQLIVGSDSHTPHSGAIGCVAFGIGTTDVFNSWITKEVRVRVPESLKIILRGRKHPNVTAKDFILKILALDYVKSGKALAKVIEYAGEAIEELSVDERATMTNMAAEIGGFTGIVAPDQRAVEFLMARRGLDRKTAAGLIEGLYSDPGAEYAHVIELDAAEITPMVATPGDPGNGRFIRELDIPVPIELAYGGTCTAGKNEDMDMYARVLADALKQGKRVASSVEFYIQFGSQETREYCLRKGYLEIFHEAGSACNRAQLRSLHQRRAGSHNPAGASRDQRPEPQFPRTQRAGADVPGESADRGSERRGRLHRGIRAQSRTGARGSVGERSSHPVFDLRISVRKGTFAHSCSAGPMAWLRSLGGWSFGAAPPGGSWRISGRASPRPKNGRNSPPMAEKSPFDAIGDVGGGRSRYPVRAAAFLLECAVL
jgi:3-isopropylmalate/(R)-2-methylmalate dehydratase large subunit